MTKYILSILLLVIGSSLLYAEITTKIYPLTENTYPAIAGSASVLSEIDELALIKTGFSAEALASIQASENSYLTTLSLDPFVFNIAKAATSLGANIVVVAKEYLKNSKTQGITDVSATAYRIAYKNKVLLPTDIVYTGEAYLRSQATFLDFIAAKKELEGMRYYQEREKIYQSAIGVFIKGYFQIDSSTDSVIITPDTDCATISKQQIDKLEKVTGRIAQGTISEVIVGNYPSFEKEITKIYTAMLIDLKNKYPADYKDFKEKYKSVYNTTLPEEPKPQKTGSRPVKIK